MRNLKTIEGKVKAILEKDEEARNDDMLLYLKVCNTCLKDTGAMPFAEVARKILNFLKRNMVSAAVRISIQTVHRAVLGLVEKVLP